MDLWTRPLDARTQVVAFFRAHPGAVPPWDGENLAKRRGAQYPRWLRTPEGPACPPGGWLTIQA